MTDLRCPICTLEADSTREHVLPSWFLRGHDPRGPFTIERNGVPIPKRDGSVERPEIERVILKVCSECNGWLSTTFEVQPEQSVWAVLNGSPIGGVDLTAFALWAVKTLLLYAHPETVHTQTQHLKDLRRSRLEGLDRLLHAMRSSGDIPADVSLWLAVVDPDAVTDLLVRFDQTEIPGQTSRPDGAGGISGSVTLGLGNGTRRTHVIFYLLVHPLIDVVNPWEAAGMAVRLWPDPPQVLDVSTLQPLDSSAASEFGRWCLSGGPSVGLGANERWSTRHPMMLDHAIPYLTRRSHVERPE